MKLNHDLKSADSKEHKDITWKGSRMKNSQKLYFIPNKRIKRKKKGERAQFFFCSKKADFLEALEHFHNLSFRSFIKYLMLTKCRCKFSIWRAKIAWFEVRTKFLAVFPLLRFWLKHNWSFRGHCGNLRTYIGSRNGKHLTFRFIDNS